MNHDTEKLEKILSKMEKIETMLEQLLQKGTPQFWNIERIVFHSPLQEYTFDAIDIDEVSGAMNLGNNLGVEVDKAKELNSKPPTNQKKKSQSKPDHETETPSSKDQKAKESNKSHLDFIEKQVEEKLKEIFPNNMKPEEHDLHIEHTPNNTAKNSEPEQAIGVEEAQEKDGQKLNSEKKKDAPEVRETHLPDVEKDSHYYSDKGREAKGIAETHILEKAEGTTENAISKQEETITSHRSMRTAEKIAKASGNQNQSKNTAMQMTSNSQIAPVNNHEAKSIKKQNNASRVESQRKNFIKKKRNPGYKYQPQPVNSRYNNAENYQQTLVETATGYTINF